MHFQSGSHGELLSSLTPLCLSLISGTPQLHFPSQTKLTPPTPMLPFYFVVESQLPYWPGPG